jgi:hypothetical protein
MILEKPRKAEWNHWKDSILRALAAAWLERFRVQHRI